MTEQSRVDNSIIEHLYDVALDPTSYERLLEYWDDMIRPALQGEESPEMVGENVARFTDHLHRADKVLGHSFGAPPEESADVAVGRIRHAATFAVNLHGRLVAVNAPATLMLGVTGGARAIDLPLETGEADRLLEKSRSMLRGSATTTVLCLRNRGAGRLVVVHLRLFRPLSGEPFILCITSEVSWPTGFSEELQRSFGLSAAEIEVLRHLTEGYCIADIARLRTRSPETVRVQVKSMLMKTGARSQLELVRLALSTVETLHGVAAATLPRDASQQVEAPTRRVKLPGGRQMEYLLLGAPDGRPVLFLPIDLGFTRWPVAAEAEARRRKLKVIVGIRPGYDGSSPVPADKDYFTQLIADHLALLDHLGAERVPLLTLGDDSLLALQLHMAAPSRFSALICCGGVMPFTNPDQYQRMGKWHRFIVTGAKFTPQFLPFIVKAGAALARRYGKRSFLSAIYAVSEADTATFALPEVSETLIQSSDVMLSETHSAHDAFARELIAKAKADWNLPVEHLRRSVERGDVGVHFFNGEQDPQVPIETLREFESEYPWIDFVVYPDAGQLIFYLKWRDVLDKVHQYV